MLPLPYLSFFFFNDTATTEIYTLSLHDALPIWTVAGRDRHALRDLDRRFERNLPKAGCGWSDSDWHCVRWSAAHAPARRSEEHTSELQSHVNLVCRLLLEKKKKKI